MTCPKCGAARADGAVECPRCGVIFAKVPAADRPIVEAPDTPSDAPVRATRAFGVARWLLPQDGPFSSPGIAARLVLLVGLAAWTWHFASQPMAVAGDSVLHLVNLPFHEAGHVLFMPFGRFMMSLGGSLAQLLVPLVCVGTLLARTRDPFGASVALWWCGESFLDLAPYIDDARSLQLVLLGGYTGAEVEGHDWEAILTQLGWLHLDHTLANGARAVGFLLMIAALAWAAAVLWRQRALGTRADASSSRVPSQ